jgi:hypothetical protein
MGNHFEEPLRGRASAKPRKMVTKPFDCEDKKSGVLSLMFVHEAEIGDIATKLLKDKAVNCGTLLAV